MTGQAAILARLNAISDPCSVASGQPLGLADMGLIDSVEVSPDGTATVDLRLTSPCCMMIGFFVTEIRKALTGVDGITDVVVKHDIGERWDPDMIAPAHLARRRERFARMENAARHRQGNFTDRNDTRTGSSHSGA